MHCDLMFMIQQMTSVWKQCGLWILWLTLMQMIRTGTVFLNSKALRLFIDSNIIGWKG